MTINERVKEIRKAKSLTMEEFGLRIGINRSSVSLIESGRNNPSDQTIRSICREFYVREDWLRNGTGEIYEKSLSADIGEIIHRYNLNRDSQIMLEKFVVLPAEQRRVILSYIRSVMDALLEETTSEEQDRFHIPSEELARQLAEEQEAADASSASPAIGSTESA